MKILLIILGCIIATLVILAVMAARYLKQQDQFSEEMREDAQSQRTGDSDKGGVA